jgi:hypothetical protein
MKSPLFLLATALAASAMELPPNSISSNQSFAVRNGTTFANSTLDAYEGKILVLMLMTPWCSICQSNARAVGDGILDPFQASARGTLRGKNNHGIEIDSLLLSTEPAASWDGTNATFASSNGYEVWGLDANAQRQNPRLALGYYRGGFPNGVNSSNLNNWGEDRRRVVVLNLVPNSASHGYREIVINQNFFDSSDAPMAQTLINAILPAPVTTTFAQWTAAYAFASGTSGPDHDPDRDGIVNLLEFFHGTHPLQAGSRYPGPSLVREGNTLKLVYRRAKNIGGFTLQHQASSTLAGWLPLTVGAPQVTADLGSTEDVSVTLPPGTGPFFRLSVTQNP